MAFNLVSSIIGPLVGLVTYRSALNTAEKKIKGVIDYASLKGRIEIVEACRQIQGLIDKARITYADMLDETVTKVDAKAQEVLNKIDGFVVQSCSSLDKTSESINALGMDIILAANAIPFSNKRPQLVSIKPKYVLLSGQAEIRVEFRGNFPKVAQAGYQPICRIGGTHYSPVETMTNRLVFAIPTQTLSPPHTNGISPSYGELVFPNDLSYVDWVKSWICTVTPDTFHVVVGTLPPKPGELIVESTSTIPGQQSKNLSGHNFIQFANLPKEVVVMTRVCKPRDGWKVIRGTSKLVYVVIVGPVTHKLVKENENEVIYEVTLTRPGGQKIISQANYNIYFDEEQIIPPTEKKHKVTFPVQWGQKSSLLIPGQTYKVTFVTFNGLTIECDNTSFSHPFIDIKRSGNHLEVAVKKPEEIEITSPTPPPPPAPLVAAPIVLPTPKL